MRLVPGLHPALALLSSRVLFLDAPHRAISAPPLQGADPRFTDLYGNSALEVAAGDSAEARRALKQEEAAQRVCACCGTEPAAGAKLKRCARCRLVQCEWGCACCTSACMAAALGACCGGELLVGGRHFSWCSTFTFNFQPELSCSASLSWLVCCAATDPHHAPHCPADCSTECQARHWKEAGHQKACKAAAIVMESAKFGLPPSIMFVGHTDG